jgi:hypothetical protein
MQNIFVYYYQKEVRDIYVLHFYYRGMSRRASYKLQSRKTIFLL